jgi:hypothetical protein
MVAYREAPALAQVDFTSTGSTKGCYSFIQQNLDACNIEGVECGIVSMLVNHRGYNAGRQVNPMDAPGPGQPTTPGGQGLGCNNV